MTAFRKTPVKIVSALLVAGAVAMLITMAGLMGAVDRLSSKIEILPDEVRRELRDLNTEFREAAKLPPLTSSKE